MSTAATAKPLHPLLDRRLSLISTWKIWKELWTQETCVERLLGLLHVGFEVSAYDHVEWCERFLFYFSIAEGHTEEIKKPESWESDHHDMILGRRLTWGQIRQGLAQKAFKELCRHLFKNTEDRGDMHPSWVDLLSEDDGKIFDVALAFFLHEDTFAPELRNLRSSRGKNHDIEIAMTFLVDLCKFAWSYWCEHHFDCDKNVVRVFQARRPQLIRILAGLQRFDVIKEHFMKLDDACCEILKKIALSTKMYIPSPPDWGDQHRCPSTIEEAVAGGSYAAWILTRRNIEHAQKERWRRLRKAVGERERATQQLAELEQTQST